MPVIPVPALSAVVLCGGRSQRMGQDKAGIELDGKSLLQLTCDSIPVAPDDIVVVGAPNQSLPALDSKISVVRDTSPFPGPLPALLTGMRWLRNDLSHDDPQSTVWVTGCDTPFVTTDLIRDLHYRLIQSSADAITLTENGRRNPLLAIYQLRVTNTLEQAIDRGVNRATEFLGLLNVLERPANELRTPKSGARATTNLNTPEELEAVKDLAQSQLR